MQIGPFTIAFTKSLPMRPVPQSAGRGWLRVNEPYIGAWQLNDEITVPMVAASPAVFSCVTLIASDVAKLGLRLVEQDDEGIWHETTSPAFSPVLKKPNRYQNRIKFVEHWITSKLLQGNTYVLKQRDRRGIVVALYVLDPCKVVPLVATNGDVYYQLTRDDLSQLDEQSVTVPASEIIHDRMVALYHPLIGVSPIHACGIAAVQGLSIQQNSRNFFANGSSPGGILTAPGAISNETAERLKAKWETDFSGDNAGKVAVLGDGLKYEQMAVNAADAQLIEQLKWTAETVCSCFHVQPYMISVGPPPPYANIEPLNLQYYSQCLQSLIENFELCLDEGLELPTQPRVLGTEINLDDLLRMDSTTRTNSAQTSITSGGMTINEARRKFFDLGPIAGGDTPYMQQQMWPLNQLANRSIPAIPAAPQPMPTTETPTAPEDDLKQFPFVLRLKALAMKEALYAAGG